VNFNAVRFWCGRSARRRGHGDADPPLPNLTLDNRLRLHQAPCGGYQRGVALAVQDPAVRDQVLLEGRFPAGCDEYALTRTVLQPESYAFGLFDLYWQQLGGTLAGRWRLGAVPETLGKPDYVHRSRPLGDLIRLVNKYSNNVMTRHLALTLGAERFGAPATADKGRLRGARGARRARHRHAGMVLRQPVPGCPGTRLTARQVAGVLQAGWRSPYMPEFMSSMAIAGLDGTLRRRLDEPPAPGRMHLKTGTLNDVSAVAGYLLTGRRALLVVLLVNAPDAHRGLGEDLQDVVLRWAAGLPCAGVCSVLPRQQPPAQRVGDQFGGVLLHEVAGAGYGDQGEVGVDPVPGVVQRVGIQGPVFQAMEHQHRHRQPWGIRRLNGLALRRQARVVALVVVEHGGEIRAPERLDVVRPRCRVADPAGERLGRHRAAEENVRVVGGALAKTLRVGAVGALRRVAGQLPRHAAGVGQVEDHQPLGHLRQVEGELPGHHAAPVVADDGGALGAGVADHRGNVADQIGHVVGCRIGRGIAVVVAALIHGEHPKAVGQPRHLVTPGIPVVGKAVNEHHQRPSPRLA
jgi:hypothetical protein